MLSARFISSFWNTHKWISKYLKVCIFFTHMVIFFLSISSGSSSWPIEPEFHMQLSEVPDRRVSFIVDECSIFSMTFCKISFFSSFYRMILSLIHLFIYLSIPLIYLTRYFFFLTVTYCGYKSTIYLVGFGWWTSS